MDLSKTVRKRSTLSEKPGTKGIRKLTAMLKSSKETLNVASSPLEGNTILQMLSNFIDHTGITFVSYVGTRNSYIWKLVWLTVIVAGFTMAIIQSNEAIHDYFGYATTLRTTFELNGTMQFPAVTVCSNTPVNWTHERTANTTVFQEVTAKLSDETAQQAYNKETTRKSRSYEEFVLLDVYSRYYNSGLTVTNYGVLTKLYWNGEIYTNKKSSQSKSLKTLEDEGILYQFRDFLYGDCVIFNALIDLRNTLSAAALTGAELTLEWDVRDRYPFSSDPASVIVIHSAGTPPILDDSNNIKINPGDEVSIAITQREITRLPPPFPSGCVQRTNYRLQSNSVYYQSDRPYLFSMEACIKTCMQKISLDNCRCWDPQIPLGFLRKRYRRNSMCKIDRCPQIDKKLTSKFCSCKLPCSETLLDSTLTVKSGFLKEIAKRTLTENTTEPESVESSTLQQAQQNSAKVKVFIKSSVYESIKEEPKYTVADCWGVIGGNAGFWIGISAVSLFELIELFCVIIKTKVMNLLWKKNVNSVHNRDALREQFKYANHPLPNNFINKTYKFLPEI